MKAASSTTHIKVTKAATEANTNPGEGSNALTKDNLKMVCNDGGEALNSKIESFRQGQVSQSEFTKEEKRCLWARFHRAIVLNADATSKWETLPAKGRGNHNLKNIFLWAWMKDPAWGKHFMERMSTITVTKKHSTKLSWLTYKQLCDKRGKEEADDLIKRKSIHMRPNPKNNKFYQFLDEDEQFDISNDRKKAFNASQKGDINANAFTRICGGIGTISNDEIEAIHTQQDFTDLSQEDADDDNEQTALPIALKKLMGVKRTKNKNAGKDHPGVGKGSSGAGKDPKVAGKEPKGKHKSDIAKMLDEINRTCAVLICDDKSAVMDNANKIHRIVQKVIKQLDADSRKQLLALMVKMLHKIFSETASGVKDLIIEAAQVLKSSENK